MKLNDIPFGTTDWEQIEPVEHKGERGAATWRTQQFGDIRVRMVEYTPGYLADLWCSKGHIVHCLEGEVENQLKTGETNTLTPGMTYIVSDDASHHRSFSKNGVKLLIIDGDFLRT